MGKKRLPLPSFSRSWSCVHKHGLTDIIASYQPPVKPLAFLGVLKAVNPQADCSILSIIDSLELWNLRLESQLVPARMSVQGADTMLMLMACSGRS
jgi:hypothetical protein